MKQLTKALAIILTVSMVLLAGFGTAMAAGGGWYKKSGTWRYRLDNGRDATGWVKSGQTWYYMKSNGNMATGWQKVGGKWYYMAGSGAMRTGWLKAGAWYYLTGSGAMATGWRRIDSKWYYLEANGAMAFNEWVGDYFLQTDGSMATNRWIGPYYVDNSGKWLPNYSVGNSNNNGGTGDNGNSGSSTGNGTTSSPSDGNIGASPEDAPQVFEVKMTYHEGLSRKVFDDINTERVKAGMQPYIWQDKRCGKVARLQSGYNVLRYNPDTMKIGQLPFKQHYILDISYFTGYSPASASSNAVPEWMESPLHRHALLDKDDKYCAVAVYNYQDEKGRQWVSIIAAMSNVDVDMQTYDSLVPQEYWNRILECNIE